MLLPNGEKHYLDTSLFVNHGEVDITMVRFYPVYEVGQ